MKFDFTRGDNANQVEHTKEFLAVTYDPKSESYPGILYVHDSGDFQGIPNTPEGEHSPIFLEHLLPAVEHYNSFNSRYALCLTSSGGVISTPLLIKLISLESPLRHLD